MYENNVALFVAVAESTKKIQKRFKFFMKIYRLFFFICYNISVIILFEPILYIKRK